MLNYGWTLYVICQRNLKRKTMGYGALRNGQKLRSHGHVVSWLWRPPLPPLRLTFLQLLCTFLHTVGSDELPISAHEGIHSTTCNSVASL